MLNSLHIGRIAYWTVLHVGEYCLLDSIACWTVLYVLEYCILDSNAC